MENDQIIAFVPFKKIELPLEIITDMKFTVFAPLPDGSRGEYERLYFSLPTSDALKINKIIHPITSVLALQTWSKTFKVKGFRFRNAGLTIEDLNGMAEIWGCHSGARPMVNRYEYINFFDNTLVKLDKYVDRATSKKSKINIAVERFIN